MCIRDSASATAAARLEAALSGAATTEAEMADVFAILEETGARQWTIQEAASYCDRAIAALDATGIQHPSQAALRALAGFSVKRSY